MVEKKDGGSGFVANSHPIEKCSSIFNERDALNKLLNVILICRNNLKVLVTFKCVAVHSLSRTVIVTIASRKFPFYETSFAKKSIHEAKKGGIKL